MAGKVPLEIVRHPDAPAFAGSDWRAVLNQSISEVLSGNLATGKEARSVIAQAGLVCMWFFIKMIAGHSGPFGDLNDSLHVDLCNYRQRLIDPGTRGLILLPRGHYKTATCTEGAASWEKTRDPNIRIRITNAVREVADGFRNTIWNIDRENELYQYLYPRHAIKFRQGRYITPARTRSFREDTVESGGVGTAIAGHHYDLHICDDLIGLEMLDSDRSANARMRYAINWFFSSEKPLLVSPQKSRVIVVGTRYAIDDLYGRILANVASVWGTTPSRWSPKDGGRWTAYYRKALEDGRPIFPENFAPADFSELAESDWWTWVTQYLNDPHEATASSFQYGAIKTCSLEYRDNEWYIHTGVMDNAEEIPLRYCDVLSAADPAGSSRRKDERTSRSVRVVIARDWRERHFIIHLECGYVGTIEFFDWLFDARERFGHLLRATYLETQGGFKILEHLIPREEKIRGVSLGIETFPATGDKDARITSAIGPELDRGTLYIASPYLPALSEELLGFPMSKKKDILDALAAGLRFGITPMAPENIASARERRSLRARGATSNATGY